MYRTKQGLILEKLLSSMKDRYILCWDGEGTCAYDCACCICDDSRCGCVCHTRIESMASAPGMKLFLLAAEAMGELPKFFTSYAEKLVHSKNILIEHADSRSVGSVDHKVRGIPDCRCEFCEFARNDLKVRKFAIEGEDNSHINDGDADVRSDHLFCNKVEVRCE